jgi:hypothetical protein
MFVRVAVGLVVAVSVAGCSSDHVTSGTAPVTSVATTETTSAGTNVADTPPLFPAKPTFYGGPLLSLPTVGSWAWVCTGRTGNSRRFHVRYVGSTDARVVVRRRHLPTLHFGAVQDGAILLVPWQPAGWQRWSITSGGEPCTTVANIQFQFAVTSGSCHVHGLTVSQIFTPSG